MDFEAQLQFKKDFGMTINDAERIAMERKKASDEIFSLKLYLNGFDIVTGSKVKPTKEEIEVVNKRIEKLYQVK